MPVSIDGGKAIKEFLAAVKTNPVEGQVGFFPESRYDDGTSVATVAFLNHYGHINTGEAAQKYGRVIPARPFMQKTFDENRVKWRKQLQDIINTQIQNGQKINPELALKVVSKIAAKDVQEMIDWFASSGQPRNGPKMQALKGFDSPLIWKGIMRQSVQSQVVKK